MRFKKTRIAFSVFFGILSLLLIGLWLRSYWRHDIAEIQHANVIIQQTTLGQYFFLASDRGRCACLNVTSGVSPWRIKTVSAPLGQNQIAGFPFNLREDHLWMGFDAYHFSTTDYGIFAPHWFLVMLIGSCAALPWFHWRFSLKTLLIFTTIISLAMGVTIFLAKH